MDSEEDDTEDLFPTSQKPQETSIRRSIGEAAKRQTTEIEGLPKTCELMTVLSSSGLILDETRDIEALHKLDCEQVGLIFSCLIFLSKLETFPSFRHCSRKKWRKL